MLVTAFSTRKPARKTARDTARWDTLAISLPKGPGELVSVYYLRSLPVTAKGHTHVLLVTDRKSRRAGMFAVTAADFTAKGRPIS